MTCLFERLANKNISVTESVRNNVLNIMLSIWRYQSSSDVDLLHKLILRYDQRVSDLTIDLKQDMIYIMISLKCGTVMSVTTRNDY